MARLKQEKFRIFISHKHADKDLANLVKTELNGLGSGIVECWVSGQELTVGMDWDREIKQNLGESHLLVLLFTTPAQQWDWCLFEVGLFTRFDRQDASVVCIYDPAGSPPGPLTQVQGVRADAADLVTKFLRPLCTETWRVADDWRLGALDPDPDAAKLGVVAERIASGFANALHGHTPEADAGVYSYRPCHRVVLDLTPVDGHAGWTGIPLDALVIEGSDATTNYTLSLFGVQERTAKHRWSDLVEAGGGRDAPWRRDLDQCFVDGLAGKLFKPSSSVVEVWQPPGESRRSYRPVIYEIDRRSTDDAPMRVTVLLVPGGPTASA